MTAASEPVEPADTAVTVAVFHNEPVDLPFRFL